MNIFKKFTTVKNSMKFLLSWALLSTNLCINTAETLVTYQYLLQHHTICTTRMSYSMSILLLACCCCSGVLSAINYPNYGQWSHDGLIKPYRKGPFEQIKDYRFPPPYVRIARSLNDEEISAGDNEEQVFGEVMAEQRPKRSPAENVETEHEEVEGEIVDEKEVPKDAEKIEVSPNGEYEEVTSGPTEGGRTKRASVTIIRIRNRRTGKVVYVVIRRR